MRNVGCLALVFSLLSQVAFAKSVIADVVFWDQARGFQSVQNNLDVYTEVSPFWYYTDANGIIQAYRGSLTTYEDPDMVALLRSQGKKVTPTITNLLNGYFDGQLVSGILNNATRRASNISSIVNLTVNKGYDGIDLDYENLLAADRNAFSLFVRDLAAALHAQGKTLSVNVYGKTSEPGSWNGPQAQDLAALGSSADSLRFMTYEYHWSTSAAGPIAPLYWVDAVLAFAVTQIPASKVIHGLPMWGYDWVGMQAVDRTYGDIVSLINQVGATVNWDSGSQTPWFTYYAGNVKHEVWFENQYSIDAKLTSSLKNDVGGVFFWRMGGEDPAIANVVRSRMPASTPSMDPPPATTTTTTLPPKKKRGRR